MFGIDADWGNGKTTFVRMLHAFLRKGGFPVVTFNAWESDYVSGPFTAIATELTDALGEYAGESAPETRRKIDVGLIRAKGVIKSRAPAVLRALAARGATAAGTQQHCATGFAASCWKPG